MHDLSCRDTRREADDDVALRRGYGVHLDTNDTRTSAGHLQAENIQEMLGLLRDRTKFLDEVILEFLEHRFVFAPRKLLVHGDFLLLIGDIERWKECLERQDDLRRRPNLLLVARSPTLQFLDGTLQHTEIVAHADRLHIARL